MKRPLVLFSLSLIAGIAAAYISQSFPFVILSIIAAAISAYIFHDKLSWKTYILIGLIVFYSAGALEFLYINSLNAKKFEGFAGSQVTIRGFVAAEPDIRESKISYIVRAKEIKSENKTKKIDAKIVVNTLRSEKGAVYEYGQDIEIKGQLSTPSAQRNPGGFDYRRYLLQSGISASVFATGDNIIAGEITHAGFITRAGLGIRNSVINVINKSLPAQQAGLLNGMLIGYRNGLSKEVQQAFSDAGLTHIMAVSGANIAFIVLPLVFLFKKLRLRQNVANAIIIGILVLFVFVTGFSPSVLRAVIMAVIVLAGQIIRRETDVFASISLAAILLLLYNPNSLFDIGFQLSFTATLSLVVLYKSIRGRLNFKFIPAIIVDTLAVTLSAQIGVLPVTAYYFNKISIISIITNILVVPITQIITILGFAMAILGQINTSLSQLIGYINSTFLTFILYVCKISAQFPFATIRVVTPHILLVAAYYMILLFFLKYRSLFNNNLQSKHYAVVFSGFVLAACFYLLYPGQLEVVFIDVGEGDAALIRTYKGTTVLIDGGGHSSRTQTGTNIGETVVIPFLLDYGVSKLDVVVATHGHDDHIEGLIPVLKEFKVGELVIPDAQDKKEFKTLLDISKDRGVEVTACRRGDTIKLDEKTNFHVLHPYAGFTSAKSSLNNSSLVLKLNYEHVSILFTGDIEEEAEDMLVEAKANLNAMVLKVAHHGSDGSTTSHFLKAVNPKAAVICVGRNTFGHPSKRVVEELENSNIRLFRTDENGAVVLTSNGKTIKLKKTVREK